MSGEIYSDESSLNDEIQYLEERFGHLRRDFNDLQREQQSRTRDMLDLRKEVLDLRNHARILHEFMELVVEHMIAMPYAASSPTPGGSRSPMERRERLHSMAAQLRRLRSDAVRQGWVDLDAVHEQRQQEEERLRRLKEIPEEYRRDPGTWTKLTEWFDPRRK